MIAGHEVFIELDGVFAFVQFVVWKQFFQTETDFLAHQRSITDDEVTTLFGHNIAGACQ